MDSEETSPQPDNRLNPWLEDGNVVLEAEDKFFRVHRSVLSASSQVFKDAFALPQPLADSEDEKLDGCPVIHLQDKAVDLQHVLKALCYRGYGSVSDPTQLYREAYEVVKGYYPTTLPPDSLGLSPRRQQRDREPPDFELVNIAREVGLTSVLPVALYRCSQGRMAAILLGYKPKDGSARLLLSSINQRACIIGRDRSRKLLAITFKWVTSMKLSDQGGCIELECMTGMFMMIAQIWVRGGPECDPFMPWAPEWDRGLEMSIEKLLHIFDRFPRNFAVRLSRVQAEKNETSMTEYVPGKDCAYVCWDYAPALRARDNGK
ncbi:hypothetical protein HYDPIDRAFT_28286 [Hydnomerulius pinastri MD-312]|uniref:BTB domain-containing protein n=1 Tax=Hydnomerulius pinastri MD-312 TaxID=994086 RepID=A0A0C9W1W4_9AGAM|nr:hypothetical protein HYDPIDRAFT_28286 [Hydnomerulius pinastri MD-312]